MTFKQIFDSKAPINSGLMPIWLVASVVTLFSPYFPERIDAAALMPFAWLIGLHWLFRFGKWVEFRIRPKGAPPSES